MRKLDQRGVTLVELVIAVAILATLASSVMLARSYMAKQTVRTSDKSYATQKAIQMFEELKALVNGNEKVGVNVLDQYSDGSQYNNILTTDKNVDTGQANANPGDPLSGNRLSNGNWRYLRQVAVNRVANDPYTRQVIIKVWRYQSDYNPTQPGELLAEVGGQLRTITNIFPPTQVMDIYVLAINNIAAWWAHEPVLYSTFQNIIQDIQGRNPGLEIRPHYITRSSYGRDPQYVPYINSAQATNSTTNGGVIPWVYFYPGNTIEDAADGGVSDSFYDPSAVGVQVDGAFNVDGTTYQTSGQFNGCPNYSVADIYNHSARYPDELAMYNAVTTAAANAVPAVTAQNSVTEISWRMLMEGMLSQPVSYQNALIVNLHGELLPLPPLRNYSDPAKDPNNSSGSGGLYERVVTHPEMLYYPTSGTSSSVTLRTYAYYDGMDDITTLDTNGSTADANQRVPFTSVFLPDVTLTSANIQAVAIVGDKNAGVTYQAVTLTSGAAATMGMSVTVTNPGPGNTQTLITLVNTPLRCLGLHNAGGVSTTARLNGLEYIPCPVGTDFTQNLTNTTDGSPKNTARWIIQISNMPVTSTLNFTAPVTIMGQVYNGTNTFIGQHIIETNFGQTPTGPSWPSTAPNLSRTYVWVGNAVPPPYTERFQFQGDPRHCPYLDCKVGGPQVSGAGATIVANSYNWFFRNMNGTVDGYSGFDAGGNVNVAGWGGDKNFVDIPRFYQMIRTGFLKVTGIWSTMNGWSYYYYGMGGEMGSDQQPFNTGVQVNETPWQTTQTSTVGGVCEMISGTGPVSFLRDISNTNDTWYAKPWLGELYPDSAYATWATSGNLQVAGASTSNSKFYRKLWGSIATAGTNSSLGGLGRNTNSRTNSNGCTSFYNGTSGSGQMNHEGVSGTDTLLSLGATLYGIFQYPLPLNVVNTSGNMRPWRLSDSQTDTEWTWPPYNTHTNLSIPAIGGVSREFYSSDQSGWKATGVVQVDDGAGNEAFVVESGLAIAANVGTADLGKTAIVCMLRTFLDGGLYSGGAHITQVPLIRSYVDSLNAQYYQPTTITVLVDGPVTTGNPVTVGGVSYPSGPTTNIWYRYPGITSSIANLYTEEYPGYPNLNNSTYTESVTLDLNLKYSNDGGNHWYFMQDNFPAQKGILDTSPSRMATVTTMPYSYAWSVPAASFPQGDYFIMVEAYRAGFPLNYCYHTLDVAINR